MNKRFLSVVVFAVVVAGAASLLIYGMVVSHLGTTAKAAPNRIVVATRNLELGALVHDVDLTLVDWTGPGPPQALKKQEDGVGRGVVANIYQGEPVLDTRLAPRGAGAGLATLIPKGMRAAAVKVDEVVGLAGFVVPGMRVDVLMSGVAPGDQQNSSETKTILQNIEVLSAGQTFQKDAEGRPVTSQVVNLLVTPEQAESLDLASTQTHIQLVLRNPLDTEQAQTPGRMLAQLFGRPMPPPPAPKAAPRPQPRTPPPPPPAPPPVQVEVKVVEVLHGSKMTVQKFTESPETRP
jgi:pilus assembly protein CpaB